MIKRGDRVEFADGHAQRVTAVHAELDDWIIWLHQRHPDDPAWVSLDELTYEEPTGRWLFNG